MAGGEVMTAVQVDYLAVFRQLPVDVVLLTPEFVIADANEAFLQAAGRRREDVLGLSMFDAFPDSPWDPGATGERNLRASLGRVLATGEPDPMEFQRHDLEVPGSPGRFARRYWSVVSAPVSGPDSRVVLIAFCGQEVTERLNRFMSVLEADAADGEPG
jgi:PAS domain-containing protein